METSPTQFAKKENIIVPTDILSEMNVQIPPIFYWEDVYQGKSQLMTMAFKWHNMNYGYSYPIEDENTVRLEMLRRRLFNRVSETLDCLVHHGTKVLDINGNIDPRLVNDQEAIRDYYDKNWKNKIAAFKKLVKIAPITKEKAMSLKLIDAPKIF